MASKVTYKVLSPFLTSNKRRTFNDILEAKDFSPGDLDKRLESRHVIAVNDDKSNKKGFLDKLKP